MMPDVTYHDEDAEWLDDYLLWTKAEAIMAGNNVIYDTGKFSWLYTPPVVPAPNPATELRLKWGTTATPTNVKVCALSTVQAYVRDVLPAGSNGQFYAQIAVWNGVKEGPVSPVVPFVLSDGTAGGEISFTVA